MTPLALVSWAAHLGWLKVDGTAMAFFGATWAPWVFTLFAMGELVADKLPRTPSRTTPFPFGGRVVTGALSGAAIGAASGAMVVGGLAGAVGAVVGTLGGHAFRARLAAKFGKDRPAALIEDAVAIGGALLIGLALR